ncbi:MAG TPA: GxxExxY protein [Ferruginibacter sp.]|nr:GxxExxY protein [Ferruginibacter sp.]
MTENQIATIVLDEAIHIHKSIGPGLLESSYQHCLKYRLLKKNLNVRIEVPVPLVFEDVKLECGYRADLVIDNKVVIEVKSIDAIAPIHLAQTLTYLRLLKLKLGIVLNFNSVLMKDGIKRVVNNL